MGPDPVPEAHRGVELIIHSIAWMAGRQYSKKHSQNTVITWDLHANVPCRSGLHPSWCLTRFWCSANIEESRYVFAQLRWIWCCPVSRQNFTKFAFHFMNWLIRLKSEQNRNDAVPPLLSLLLRSSILPLVAVFHSVPVRLNFRLWKEKYLLNWN